MKYSTGGVLRQNTTLSFALYCACIIKYPPAKFFIQHLQLYYFFMYSKIMTEFFKFDISLTDTVDYDYTPRRSGQITVIIPAGRTSVSFDVTILDDIIIEEDIESFQLSIVDVSLPHDVSVGRIQNATVNIIDDDCKYSYLLNIQFPLNKIIT